MKKCALQTPQVVYIVYAPVTNFMFMQKLSFKPDLKLENLILYLLILGWCANDNLMKFLYFVS